MKVFEQYRNLHIELDEDHKYVIKPVIAKVGAELFSLWLGIAFAESKTLEKDAERLHTLSLGEENKRRVEFLRADEMVRVTNAAFFWQTTHGGIAVVEEMLSGGLKKAQNLLLENAGLLTMYEQWQESLNSASALLIQSLAATPATNIPPAFANSSKMAAKTKTPSKPQPKASAPHKSSK